MNNTQEEAVSTLIEWAEGDEGTRSLLIIADEEDNTRLVYNGTDLSLVAALAVAMRKDEIIRQVCADAMKLLRITKPVKQTKKNNDKAESNND